MNAAATAARLFRTALRIPDYFHPRLNLERDFLFGRIGKYPITMQAKAEYKDEMTEDSVPAIVENGGRIAQPVMVALYGLGSHDAFLETRVERYSMQMMHALRWLETHHVKLGNGIGWMQKQDVLPFKLKAPWFSAIVQGLVLSLFVRAHQMNESALWRELAHQTLLGFRVPVAEGGFSRRVANGVIYEEYPAPDLDCVFNGMCKALIGLWEAFRFGLVLDAEIDFNRGVAGLRSFLPQFDLNGWSLYSLNQCLGKPFLASPFYHRANGLLSIVMAHLTGDSEFQLYGERWLRTGENLPRRMSVSFQTGLARIRFGRRLAAEQVALQRPNQEVS